MCSWNATSLTSYQKGTTYCPDLSAYNSAGPAGQGGVYSKALTDLIHECLYEVPSHRPTARQLKERIWLVTNVIIDEGGEPSKFEDLSTFIAQPSQPVQNAVPAPVAVVAAPAPAPAPAQVVAPAVAAAPQVIAAAAQAVRPANPNPLNSGRNCSCLIGMVPRANGTTQGPPRWCRNAPSKRPIHPLKDRCRLHQDLIRDPDYIPPPAGAPAAFAARRARRR